MATPIVKSIFEQLARLPDELQRQVLVFVRVLKATLRSGMSGRHLSRFSGSIPLDDLRIIGTAIEADCPQ